MGLGRYLEYNGEDYICTLCDRCFGSTTALYAHCRHTSYHDWCERCWRIFRTTAAKEAHLRESSAHHICYDCNGDLDFASYSRLEKHRVKAHHYCPPCGRFFRSPVALQNHDVSEHFLCITCGDFFMNANALRMHKQKHQPRDLQCYGNYDANCYRTFKSFSGMLIHLESNACVSGTTENDIINIATNFDCSDEYFDEFTDPMFFCPSCESRFNKLSALYQHVEDVPDCSSSVLDWLEDEICESI
ncbi:hypothetical protein BJX63DRAFT_377172 [Aspergillus granulosus]|uniref:C2H2-type domain-containing protein n=1 Tax=Aspergillus granulosus TaxID=176169 RepID=A0ABR4I6Y7_9EURO